MESEFDTENVSSESHEKTVQWLEEILQTYYSRLEKVKIGDKTKTKDDDQVHPIQIIDFDIGPGFAVGDGRVSTLSDLLSLHVRYKV
jgi:hypothetical protein